MKTYRLTRDRNHSCTLHVIDAEATRLPMLIGSDQYPAGPMLTVAMTLLLDYFKGEERAEAKARTLARPLAQQVNRFGEEWTLTQTQLNDAVMDIMVKMKGDVCVEYLGGQRRDTTRNLVRRLVR